MRLPRLRPKPAHHLTRRKFLGRRKNIETINIRTLRGKPLKSGRGNQKQSLSRMPGARQIPTGRAAQSTRLDGGRSRPLARRVRPRRSRDGRRTHGDRRGAARAASFRLVGQPRLAALHPADPIKCRMSTQRTQATESGDTRKSLPSLTEFRNTIYLFSIVCIHLSQ